jgi:hypothetical protein
LKNLFLAQNVILVGSEPPAVKKADERRQPDHDAGHGYAFLDQPGNEERHGDDTRRSFEDGKANHLGFIHNSFFFFLCGGLSLYRMARPL